MLWFLTAIVTASLLGSLHCIGMCGPLALWASGSDQFQAPAVRIATAVYHGGRAVCYIVVGIAAGWFGKALNWSGEGMGVPTMALRVAGVVLMVAGLVRLGRSPLMIHVWARMRPRRPTPTVASPASRGVLLQVANRVLIAWRPMIFRMPLLWRAFLVGLLTALLPCGWLYLFAIVAMSTGSWQHGASVMVAFWIGTLPALVTWVAGATWFQSRFRRTAPVALAILMLGGGAMLLGKQTNLSAPRWQRMRAAIDTASSPTGTSLVAAKKDASIPLPAASWWQRVRLLLGMPLPCCETDHDFWEAPTGEEVPACPHCVAGEARPIDEGQE
ncbi:MAG: hypothetical protein KatS3mg111_2485 [Pirellulaceae bacterium]|nr:MAG: hypothetical protein KatS3mg111_2485 [Pirellulaceae bacterium]